MRLDEQKTASWAVIVGVPVALGLCGWGLSEIITSGKTIERMLAVVEGIQGDIKSQDKRLDRLEDGYFRKHP